MKKTLKYSLYSVATLLTLIAVVSIIARIFILDISEYRSQVVEMLRESFEKEIEIGEIAASIRGFDLLIEVNNLQLTAKEAPQKKIEVEQADITIDGLSSLLRLSPVIERIKVKGAKLQVETDRENRLHIPQLGITRPVSHLIGGLAQVGNQSKKVEHPDLHIEKLDIQWFRPDAEPLQITDVAIVLTEQGDADLQGSVAMQLPQYFGDDLYISWDSQRNFRIKANNLNIHNLLSEAQIESSAKGTVSVSLDGSLPTELGLPNKLSGSISLKDFATEQMSLDFLKSDLVWRKEHQKNQLGLVNLSFQSSELMLKDAKLGIVQNMTPQGAYSTVQFESEQAITFPPELMDSMQKTFDKQWGGQISTMIEELNAMDAVAYFAHGKQWVIGTEEWSSQPLRLPQWNEDLRMIKTNAKLDLRKVQINTATRTEPLKVLDRVSLDLTYDNNENNEMLDIKDIQIQSKEQMISGRLLTQKRDSVPYLDAALKAQRIMPDEWANWVTLGSEHAVKSYLASLFKSGQLNDVSFVFQGNPMEFFASDNKLEINAQLIDVEIFYYKNLPTLKEVNGEIQMVNNAISGNLSSAKTLNTKMDGVHFEVDDLKQPYLRVKTKATGHFQDIFTYLNAMPFQSISGMLEGIKVDGEIKTDVNLGIPLSNKTKATQKGAFSVGVSLDNNSFALGEMPALNQLTGRIVFTERGGEANQISGSFKGYPVSVNAYPQSGATEIEIIANAIPAKTIAELAKITPTSMSGATDWKVQAFIPSFIGNPNQSAQGSPEVRLTVTSNLKGLRVDLPAPLTKPSATEVAFYYETPIGAPRVTHKLVYGDILQAQIAQTATAEESIVGILQFSPQDDQQIPFAETSNFKVRGNIEELSLTEWKQWLDENTESSKNPQASSQNLISLISDTSITVETLNFDDAVFNDVAIRVNKSKSGRVNIKLAAPELAGRIIFPAKNKERYYLDIERLHLDSKLFASTETTTQNDFDPRDLPPFSAKIKSFKLGNVGMDNVKVLVNTQEKGIDVTLFRFEKIYKDKAIMKTRAVGSWIKNEDDSHQSTLDFTTVGSDYGRLLRQWGYSTGIREAKGTIEGEVLWSDAMHKFGIESLEGDIKVKIKDGRMRTVETGPGKLLGLLNIRTILRRLTLDFRDIFKKGFSFTSFRGTLKFAAGDMYADQLTIKSNSLNMAISGRTGIIAKDYDQVIDVAPKFSSGIPWATALLGGPIAGAIALVIDKTTDLGKKINKTLTLRYTLKGSWENPEVEFVEAPKVNKLNPKEKLKKLFEDIGEKMIPDKFK